jgi:hypothetical protein
MGHEAASKDAVIRTYSHPPHTAAEPTAARRVLPPHTATGPEAAPKDAVIQPYPHPPHTAAKAKTARRSLPLRPTSRLFSPGIRGVKLSRGTRARNHTIQRA